MFEGEEGWKSRKGGETRGKIIFIFVRGERHMNQKCSQAKKAKKAVKAERQEVGPIRLRFIFFASFFRGRFCESKILVGAESRKSRRRKCRESCKKSRESDRKGTRNQLLHARPIYIISKNFRAGRCLTQKRGACGTTRS